MTVIPLQQTSSVTAPFRLASLRDSPFVHPRGVGWKPHRWGTARDDRGGRINTGKTCFVCCICKFTCKYSLNTCKSMKLGNWHQIDLKYPQNLLHSSIVSCPPCLAPGRSWWRWPHQPGRVLSGDEEVLTPKDAEDEIYGNVWRLLRHQHHQLLFFWNPFAGVYGSLWWETLVYLTKAGDESTGRLGQWWRLSRPGPGWMIGWVEMYPKRKSWSSWSFQIYVSSIYCIYIINK